MNVGSGSCNNYKLFNDFLPLWGGGVVEGGTSESGEGGET